MRSKDLKELRKSFDDFYGSLGEVVKNTRKRGKVARKKVSVKNEDFEDSYDDEDIEDEDIDDEDIDDEEYTEEDLDLEESVIDIAEAVVDMVDSLPDEVGEEVKDQLLMDAADEIEGGSGAEEVVENVRRRVLNIRRSVKNARGRRSRSAAINARRARIANARRLHNARRRRLFNAACSEADGLKKAGPKYQNPISKFKNTRYRFYNENGPEDLSAGYDLREAEDGESIRSIDTPDDTGYGDAGNNSYWPNDEPSGKSAINTYNARVRRILNKARAYDALMNSMGVAGGAAGAKAGRVNLDNPYERDAYNAGVLQNRRYFLSNGRVFMVNADGTVAPANTGPGAGVPEEAVAPGAAGDFGGGININIDPGQDGVIGPEDVDVSLGGEPMDVEPADAGAEMGYDEQYGGGMPLPGEGGAPAAPQQAAIPQFNSRRRRVRNTRGYRPVYNNKTNQTNQKPASTETQVNNSSVADTGLDIPSTFPKKAE